MWDPSAGFGGRLLGALASRKVTKYVGSDPASLTMDGLREMRKELPLLMQGLGHEPPEIELHQCGSEDFQPEPESLDTVLTSPPYWSTEKYANESTQSYVKFPTKDEWMNGYMRQTLANAHTGLKANGTLIINIAAVKSYPTLATDFVILAEASGFKLERTLKLLLSAMVGTRKQGEAHKSEPIFVFTKKETR